MRLFRLRLRLFETEQNLLCRSGRKTLAETFTLETTMPTQNSSAHFFLSCAKERIERMDATLASLEGKAAQIQAQTSVKADQFIAEMKKKRDEFESTVK